MKAYLGMDHEPGRFPCRAIRAPRVWLSVLHTAGESQWLVRLETCNVAEGGSLSCDDAKLEAEAVAAKLLDPAL